MRGLRRIARTVLALLGLACAAAGGLHAGEARQQGADPASLLESLGRSMTGFRTLSTEFVQEKHLAVFASAVVIRGRIFLEKPDRIAWHVDAPVRYSVVITASSIRQWDAETDRVQEISLAKNPVLQNVLNQLTIWFSGSYGPLLKDYDAVVLASDPPAFRFTPKAANAAARVVQDIEIGFREDHRYLKRITIRERGGDSTAITFTGTRFDAPLDARDFEVRGRV